MTLRESVQMPDGRGMILAARQTVDAQRLFRERLCLRDVAALEGDPSQIIERCGSLDAVRAELVRVDAQTLLQQTSALRPARPSRAGSRPVGTGCRPFRGGRAPSGARVMSRLSRASASDLVEIAFLLEHAIETVETARHVDAVLAV